jgi:internalin A
MQRVVVAGFLLLVSMCPAHADDAENRAIEMVQSLGGFVGRERGAPDKPVRMVVIGGDRVKDEQLKQLQPLKQLKHISLSNPGITDAGLAHLSGFPELEELALMGAKGVSDEGLKEVGKLSLKMLALPHAKITDEGLVHVAKLTKLNQLVLGGPLISDKGLKHLKPLTDLEILNLEGTRVSDNGIAELKGLTKLQTLVLADTAVTGASLGQMKDLKLKWVVLNRTRFSDKGLAILKDFKELRKLDLVQTQVTDKAIEEFEKARPEVKIFR